MTERITKAAQLEAQAKALRRAEQDFFREADRRQEELISRWGMDYVRRLSYIATRYGCAIDDLLDFISADDQVDIYRSKYDDNLSDIEAEK